MTIVEMTIVLLSRQWINRSFALLNVLAPSPSGADRDAHAVTRSVDQSWRRGESGRVMLPHLTSFGFGVAQARKRQKPAPSPVDTVGCATEMRGWAVENGKNCGIVTGVTHLSGGRFLQ